MSGGGEGGRGRTDWPLVISIAALLFGIVQFLISLNNDDQARAVELEKRLTAIECKLRLGACAGN